jgi:membrane protease YdiL (CAAX protease family)
MGIMSFFQGIHNLSKGTFWLVVILLLIRIPLLKIIEYFVVPLPGWTTQVFEVSMYLLIGILIFRERNQLADYFINKLAISIFLLSATIFRVFSFSFESNLSVIELTFWLIAIILMVLMRRKKINFEKTRGDTYIWLLKGFAIGIILSIVFAIPKYVELEEQIQQRVHNYDYLIVFFLISFLTQLVHASLAEEFLFRGFLWGCLRKIGVMDRWILVVQAGLFWIAHINYIDRGYTFWIVTPLSGFVFGLLALKSKSIATSMITHSAVNAMTYIIFDFMAYLR